jgi:hypothetical protein
LPPDTDDELMGDGVDNAAGRLCASTRRAPANEMGVIALGARLIAPLTIVARAK